MTPFCVCTPGCAARARYVSADDVQLGGWDEAGETARSRERSRQSEVPAAAGPAMAADREARSRVVAVEGVAKGSADRRVEVLVVVPAGSSARAAGDRALAGQGARRAQAKPEAPQLQSYSFTGLKWDVLPVRQSYNPAGQRTSGQTALDEHPPRLEQRRRVRVPDHVRRHDDALPLAGAGVPRRAAQRSLQRRRLGAAVQRHARRDVVDERNRRGRHGDQHALCVEHRLCRTAEHVRPRVGVPARESATWPAWATRATSTR